MQALYQLSYSPIGWSSVAAAAADPSWVAAAPSSSRFAAVGGMRAFLFATM